MTPNQTSTTKEAAIAGWGFALGGSSVNSIDVDRQFGLTEGTLQQRTGIESLARAAEGVDEVTLAEQACQFAAGDTVGEIDMLLATSETTVGHPALAASLHERLDLPSTCAAMDVGGACAG